MHFHWCKCSTVMCTYSIGAHNCTTFISIEVYPRTKWNISSLWKGVDVMGLLWMISPPPPRLVIAPPSLLMIACLYLPVMTTTMSMWWRLTLSLSLSLSAVELLTLIYVYSATHTICRSWWQCRAWSDAGRQAGRQADSFTCFLHCWIIRQRN